MHPQSQPSTKYSFHAERGKEEKNSPVSQICDPTIFECRNGLGYLGIAHDYQQNKRQNSASNNDTERENPAAGGYSSDDRTVHKKRKHTRPECDVAEPRHELPGNKEPGRPNEIIEYPFVVLVYNPKNVNDPFVDASDDCQAEQCERRAMFGQAARGYQESDQEKAEDASKQGLCHKGLARQNSGRISTPTCSVTTSLRMTDASRAKYSARATSRAGVKPSSKDPTGMTPESRAM